MAKPKPARFLQFLPEAALALVFSWAVWERFRLPLTPFADPDVWAYIGPGVDAMLGTPFHEWFGQCFLYPGFLYVMLRLGGSFRVIILVQSLLSLGTGLLLFCSWMQVRRLLPVPRVPPSVFKLAGTGMAAVYLFSTATMQFERTLRPEAVFPFAVVLQIYCNLCFTRRRFIQNRSALLSGTAAVFLSVVASLLKPSFLGVLPFANLPVIISLFRAGQPVRTRLFLVSLPALAAALLLIWPEHIFRARDPTASFYLAQSLFGIHANLINDQIAEDLAQHSPTPYSPEFLALTHEGLTQALRESREGKGKYWPALGFYGDYVRFGKAGTRPFLRELADRLGSESQAAAFCRYYYWRTVRGQPAGMSAKIARQFGVFYSFGRCPAYTTYHFLELSKLYQQTRDCLAHEPKLHQYPPLAHLLASSAALSSSRLRIGPYPLTSRVNQFLVRTHLLLCLWAIGLALWTWRSRRARPAFGIAAPTLLLLYSYNFGTVLALAIGHSLDVGRYSQYQFAYTLLPDFVSIWLAVELFIRLAGRSLGTVRANTRWSFREPQNRFRPSRSGPIRQRKRAAMCFGNLPR